MDTNEINMNHLNKNKSDILLNYLGVFLVRKPAAILKDLKKYFWKEFV
jgi:hypothetical protein